MPDFLPIIGPLDDIIVVALALRYAGRQIPREVLLAAWPGIHACSSDSWARPFRKAISGSGHHDLTTSVEHIPPPPDHRARVMSTSYEQPDRRGGMEEFELQLLLGRIRQLSDEHRHLLEQPRRVMGDNAWVGPSARAFDHELEGNSRALHVQLQKAIDLVQAKLPTRIL